MSVVEAWSTPRCQCEADVSLAARSNWGSQCVHAVTALELKPSMERVATLRPGLPVGAGATGLDRRGELPCKLAGGST